ncbi:hypothetical protein Ga0100231_008495 [Opitutaceae bacterium TAV4]|nr:hypothetical protein Ga0100231_008495 [Opitutaceae bacterium TAV4]RRJ98483.1 hypothetical protein Ga0100230_008775 [Opitutaceae bacterium TAV3]
MKKSRCTPLLLLPSLLALTATPIFATAPTVPATPDFTLLPAAAQSLEEFTRQVTPDGAKWGGPEFAVEALVVRLPATEQLKEFPAEPTPEILAAAARFHVRLRPGLAGGVEQLTMIDRTPAGVRVANPQPVGMRFYAYALPLPDSTPAAAATKTDAKIPAFDVRLMISYALLEGFVEDKRGGSMHLTRHFSEASSQLRLTRGWLLMGGSQRGRDELTETKDGVKRSKMLHGFYFRIADEHPAEPAQKPMNPTSSSAPNGK